MRDKLTVMLELTRKCNIYCSHCYNNSSPHSAIQLTIDEIKQLICDLKKIESKFPLERIILTGGEFSMMDNSKIILEMIKKEFDTIIRIETNGYLFKNKIKDFSDYNVDEYYISIDKFHGSLNNDGSSDLLEFFLNNIPKSKKIIARITIDESDEKLRDEFIKKYENNSNLVIEAKFVSPSGRAQQNIKKFKNFKYEENPELFHCLAKNYILFNTSRKWYCCYTACKLSYVSNLGDKKILEKFIKKSNSKELINIREKGIMSLIKNESIKKKFQKQNFYYRCEPCLYLQKITNPKIVLLDLPAVDTVQDVYIKGFIFSTFTEKYLKPMLELSGMNVEYYNLNNCNIKETVDKINKEKNPVYIHLTANKYYSYKMIKKIIKNKILVGGPLPKFYKDAFKDVVVIDDELEEDGILHYFNDYDNDNCWERPDFIPANTSNNFENNTVSKDFSNLVLFSRGCYYRCNFCIHSCFHKTVHIRNIQSIKSELNHFRKDKTSIYIADPSVGMLNKYQDILKLLSEYKNLSFSMNVRADQINEDFINLIKNVNIDKLYIGVENIDNEILKKYQKGESINSIENAIELLKRNKIKYHLSFIIGNDFDLKTVKSIDNKFKADSYSFHFYINYPMPNKDITSIEMFDSKEWPYQVSIDNEKNSKLKKEIAKYFGYPVNKYHTITPHDHSKTFEIISKKLDELERVVNAYIKQ